MKSTLSTLSFLGAGVAALLLLPTGGLDAQERFKFYERGPYRSEVPRPSDLLGYEAGARHTQYAEQQAVLDALVAAAPDRVRTEVIGVTEEGRTMRVLLISSPANIARLDEIRADVERLADPRTTSPEEAQAIVIRDPVVVMLSYSIHGNEPAGFEAAMWVAHRALRSVVQLAIHGDRRAVLLRVERALGHLGSVRTLPVRHEP
jgi:hypothetical protein